MLASAADADVDDDNAAAATTGTLLVILLRVWWRRVWIAICVGFVWKEGREGGREKGRKRDEILRGKKLHTSHMWQKEPHAARNLRRESMHAGGVCSVCVLVVVGWG